MELKNTFRYFKFQPAIVGIFRDQLNLTKIVQELQDKKFTSDEIKFLSPKSYELHDFKNSADVVTGTYTGALIGLIVGMACTLLASFNFITIPGQATWREIGGFLSAIAGASLGMNTGAFSGALVGYLVSKIERHRIEMYMEKKGIVISVKAAEPKRQLMAKNIFVKHGAIRVLNPFYENRENSFSF